MKPLTEYTRKRNFKVSPEPAAKVKRKAKSKALTFVVQEHHASHLHYDFRLEWKGVLKSWAVPRGPSLDPAQKRLAVEVEDHPLEYAKFEGTIPANQYGAGEVFRWDYGTWQPDNDPDQGLKKGRLEFTLKGGKLKGGFLLVRTARQSGKKPNWLLIKRHDEYAVEGESAEVSAKDTEMHFVPPQLAQLVTKPPAGDDWVHEIKYDGYRIQAHVRKERTSLFTRRGLNWTDKYASLAKILKGIDVDSAVFDGEIVWQNESGQTDFQALQNAMKAKNTQALIFWIFDLLHLDGKDLTSLPLIARKDRLEKILAKLNHPQIRYSEHFRGVGDKMIEATCKMGLEGVVSKRVDAPYVSGRRDYWVKSKCVQRQEFVIGGFTEGEGTRLGFGALLLGFYDDGKLRYAGRVGTGFNHTLLIDLGKRLHKLEIAKSPFETQSPKGRGLHWIKPQLVCEISFAEWTKEKILRAPVFQGLRDDKPPEQISIEKPKPVKGKRVMKSEAPEIKISSPERILYLREKLTKKDVAEYYASVSELILPHIADRPLALVRCPESSTKPCFFAKHFQKNPPESIIAVPEKGKQPFFTVNSPEGLMTLVQWGTLEIHPWNTHRQHVENPDQIVMDFDPDPGVSFEAVKSAALELKEILAQLGLRGFIKTTGGKGLHVQFPFEPLYGWDSVKSFAKTLVQEMVSRNPEKYTANMAKKARKGKIFIDYLRNGRGSTAIAPYALRARATSSVAMPIDWKDLKKLKAADLWTLPKAMAYLKRRTRDPWEDYFQVRQKIALLS